jgi:pimeloyl-ACP methyl ester carboxylesterase
MRRAGLALFLSLAGCGGAGAPVANVVTAPEGRISAEPVTLTAADGIKVAGVYTRAEKPRALILLFHQADSGKDEYALIAPRLAQAGYSSLRIDQRSGGDAFGGNETARQFDQRPSFLDAKQDMAAALAWGQARKLPLILWGSSYSAGLVFVLAAEHPDAVRGVMAFSPDEYFDDPAMVRTAAAKVRAPVFVTSAQEGHEIDAARAVMAAVAGVKEQFIPKLGGAHGSVTLLRAQNPEGAEAAWKAVMAYLGRVAP